MSSVDLLSRVKAALPKVATAFETDFRKELDRKTHLLDISYESLKVNVYARRKLSLREQESYDKVYAKLIAVVLRECSGKTFTSLKDPGFLQLFNSPRSSGVIFINGGYSNNFLVGVSFDAVQKFYSKYISRNPELVSTRFGSYTRFSPKKDAKGRILIDEYTTTTRTKADIGHVPSEGAEELISPLEKKIGSVLEAGSLAGNTRVINAATAALKELYNVQADLTYSFRNTTPEAIASARSVLAEGYIVVTLHTEKLNNTFAKLEKGIYDKLLAQVALSLKMETISGSNSILEDIEESLVNIISGKHKKLKSHSTRVATSKVKLKSKATFKNSTLRLPINDKVEPVLQTSTANLLVILQARLAKQIEQNMGDGNSKSLLNYKSGRLAESAKVERLSTSREGLITAFYSYMKNPYATFSEGGAQQSPKTRDPKTLISKSIREIAATLVGNRMRAVLV